MRLLQLLSEKQLNKFLKPYGTSVGDQKLDDMNNMVVSGYKFKLTYGRYQCIETPTKKIEKPSIMFNKAPNDRYYK